MKKCLFSIIFSTLFSQVVYATDWKEITTSDGSHTLFSIDTNSIHKEQNNVYVNIKTSLSDLSSDPDIVGFKNVYHVIGMKFDCDKKVATFMNISLYSKSGDELSTNKLPDTEPEAFNDTNDLVSVVSKIVCKKN